MSLVRKQKAVLKLFNELDIEIEQFRSESGLSCKAGCGECCLYPDVHATILEFLPFALRLYLKNRAIGYLESLKREKAERSYCIIYNPVGADKRGGLCSEYERRGLICRLFGFSASRKKDESMSMITCTIIKQKHRPFFIDEASSLSLIRNLPVAADYYSKLSNIDQTLGMQTYPINLAIWKAIEYVLSYYSYRRKPKL
jgi:Fe-S-cluster containining protein